MKTSYVPILGILSHVIVNLGTKKHKKPAIFGLKSYWFACNSKTTWCAELKFGDNVSAFEQARRDGGHSGAVCPQTTACAPPNENFAPPSGGLCPKEFIGLGATGVQFEAWDSQNDGWFWI